jgi:hypothetical protein
MPGPSFDAPIKPRHAIALPAIAAAALLALAACDSTASAAPTSDLAASSDAPRPSAAVVAPRSTPGPVRPPGVPPNAQPLLFGCAAGVARCTDIASGTYYTAGEWALLPGLAFTLPSGWSSLANEAGELELHRTGDDHNEIMVWRDVVPWQDGRALLAAPTDPESWIGHLGGNPCLHVSEPERAVLGEWIDLRGGGLVDLPAIAMSVPVAAKADWEMAACPDAGGIVILSDPMHWDHGFEIGGDVMNEPSCPCRSVQRLYFASIGYASHKHLLVVTLQSYGPIGDVDAAMASLQADAQPILDSLVAPAIVVDN